MRKISWIIKDENFDKSKIEFNGNKYMLGNGYIGYRGTMEEYSKEGLTACVLPSVYDKVEGKWREPVNLPNGFFLKLYCDGEPLSVLSSKIEQHEQGIDVRNAVHFRKTIFQTKTGKKVQLLIERFLSSDNVHIMCMKCSFICKEDSKIIIQIGFDDNIWDLNGPHLRKVKVDKKDEILILETVTKELGVNIFEGEAIKCDFQFIEYTDEANTLRELEVNAKAGKEYELTRYISIYSSKDCYNPEEKVIKTCSDVLKDGYDKLYEIHSQIWNNKWEASDVKLTGDDEAQLALRYSIYQLLSIAPTHSDKVSIPARGLSGQVYKGAVFWDTEMFMLPFFNATNPKIARNLLMYRYYTLDGARRKASEYGYRGAFYAWESQDTGDDACTLFNVADVFTGRPMRTYFRDKQIHISADVVYGIWEYYKHTGDFSIFIDGGAEVILECARFFYSYAYYKPEKRRYELLDVTGPDEYHERVGNNAFTNVMVKHTLEIAISVLELLSNKKKEFFDKLIIKLNYFKDIENIKNMNEALYIPKPDAETDLIEQFDGYFKLEDLSLDKLKSRMLNKNEYLGGGNGIATTTRILKQADVVTMLNLFKDNYSSEVKKANWEYYEKRTEHGSTLSACMYGMLAANLEKAQCAYNYFIKTAFVDLNGNAKQYVGNLYIGGTHPAANGGAWMDVVYGFSGITIDENKISINPHLPLKWQEVNFKLVYKGIKFNIKITKNIIIIDCVGKEPKKILVNIKNEDVYIKAGDTIEVSY